MGRTKKAKEKIVTQVMERLQGKSIAQILGEERRRGNIWYKRYNFLAILLEQKASPKLIMQAVHGMCNQGAYGYDWIAGSAGEDIRLICEERGWE
jgi:hypothetical protein